MPVDRDVDPLARPSSANYVKLRGVANNNPRWVIRIKKVVAAGGFTAYERAHRARLVAMLAPKLTHMPADAISHMVDFAFHVGFY